MAWRHDVDHGLDLHDPRLWVHLPDGFDGCDRCPDDLSL
jgi:hypothetical protein